LNDSVSFNGSILTTGVNSSRQMFLYKIDTFGNVLYGRQANCTSTGMNTGVVEPSDIDIDTSGNIYLSGNFAGVNMFIPGSPYSLNAFPGFPNQYDAFILKYNPAGTLVWARKISHIQDDIIKGITCEPNGDFYISGLFGSTQIQIGATLITNFDQTLTTVDGFIAKYATSGIPLWAKGICGNDDQLSEDIVSDHLGSIYIYCDSDGSTLIDTTFFFELKPFITKMDTSGNYQWAISLYEAGHLATRGSIARTFNGDILHAGFFSDDVAYNNIVYSATDFENAGYIARIIEGSTSFEEFTEKSLSLFPNPSSGNINIGTSYPQWELEIFNINGNRILQQKNEESFQSISISNPGLYIARISKNKKTIYRKFVITE
jgi:hypothetical protein